MRACTHTQMWAKRSKHAPVGVGSCVLVGDEKLFLFTLALPFRACIVLAPSLALTRSCACLRSASLQRCRVTALWMQRAMFSPLPCLNARTLRFWRGLIYQFSETFSFKPNEALRSHGFKWIALLKEKIDFCTFALALCQKIRPFYFFIV